jgi:hypothetical protein
MRPKSGIRFSGKIMLLTWTEREDLHRKVISRWAARAIKIGEPFADGGAP